MISLDILVFGAGLGLFMQVLTLVVQNAVPMSQMGVGDLLGDVLPVHGRRPRRIGSRCRADRADRRRVPRHLPPAIAGRAAATRSPSWSQSPDALKALKRHQPGLHEGIIQAYSHAIDRLFLVAVADRRC